MEARQLISILTLNRANLNIPRYVDTSEEEEEIDLEGVFTELLSIETEEKQLKSELNGLFKQLGLKTEI